MNSSHILKSLYLNSGYLMTLLHCTSSGYTSTNGKGLWPASGSWSFVGTDGKSIRREDGTEMVVEVTDTSLKLSFNWTKATIGGGRTESIAGQHVLSFTK